MTRAVLILLLVAGSRSMFGGIDGHVMLFPIESSFRSWGEAAWADALGQPDQSVQLEGTHGVYGPMIFESPFTVVGKYSQDLEGPAEPGACYGTELHVVARIGIFNNPETTFTGDTVTDTRGAVAQNFTPTENRYVRGVW